MSPVTKAFFEAIQDKIDGLKEELCGVADLETLRYRQGAIQNLRDLQDTDLEESL